HTTPFIWDQPARFAIENVMLSYDAYTDYRLTLDYIEDYEVIRGVFDELWSPNRHFTLDEILDFLDARPELVEHNARYRGTSWMDRHRHELHTISGGMR